MRDRANPYRAAGSFWWQDGMSYIHGPYLTEQDALVALLRHQGPPQTRWARFKRLVWEFIHS